MNIEKLKQTRELIAGVHPRKFNMSQFVDRNIFGKVAVYNNKVINFFCGSVCCIAGHAVLADRRFKINDLELLVDASTQKHVGWAKAFAEVLECTEQEAFGIAFPTQYKTAVAKAGIHKLELEDWTKDDGLRWLDFIIQKYESDNSPFASWYIYD